MSQREFIGEFQSAARGQTVSDSRDLDLFAAKPLREIETGGVTLHVRAQSQNDLSNGIAGETLLQFSDTQIFGSNAVERRDLSPQHMELAAIASGFFDTDNVHGT